MLSVGIEMTTLETRRPLAQSLLILVKGLENFDQDGILLEIYYSEIRECNNSKL